MKQRVRLRLDAVKPPGRAIVRGIAGAEGDPLTGHRGLGEGLGLVAELGPVTLLARLSRDAEGPVLRGQLAASDARRLEGALVHARGADGVALVAADEMGTFSLRGWTGELVAVDVEIEEGAWRVAWPSDAGSPAGEGTGA